MVFLRLSPLKIVILTGLAVVICLLQPAPSSAQLPLDPLTQPKFVNPLPAPAVLTGTYHEIAITEFQQSLGLVAPMLGTPLMTTVWGYGGSYPGPTIEAVKGIPIRIKWINNLPETHLLDYAIDHTLHMAHWMHGVPVSVHLHGGEVEPQSDGNPEAWFTQGFAETGPAWSKEILDYPNDQLPTTLWYHDHVLGVTRLNVYTGLAGFYLLRDPATDAPLNLPSGAYEVPLVIQDRMFFDDGSLMYPVGGDNPDIHPLWQPEFFGDFILVNGKTWPYLNVEPRKYRFRVLNGSNSRFYSLRLVENQTDRPGPGFWQIGSDGGYLDRPVLIADPDDSDARRLVVAPGERCDIIVDFSGYAPGTTFTLKNNAKSPFPNGTVVNPRTTGQIMQFRVVPLDGLDNSSISTPGPGYVTRLSDATNTRQLTLDEVMGPNGPAMAMLNGSMWDDPVTETPLLGATEVWKIVNTTADAHPIHLHLVQFQLVNRQRFNLNKYMRDYMGGMSAPDVTPYLIGHPAAPPPNEAGWKDTFKMFPDEVTTVIARFAPQDDSPSYDFDATAEPGYAWHCHILEHEDNEMMRPLKVMAPSMPKPLAGTQLPETYALAQNYPNPFNASTVIGYSLAGPSDVSIEIYDLLGRKVHKVTEKNQASGLHEFTWDSAEQPSGVYFYRLVAGDFVDTKQMTIVK